MDCDKAWEAFFKSGLVADYLRYAASAGANCEKVILKGEESGKCGSLPME